MASPVHVSLAVLLVRDRVPGAPPFLAVRPAAPPGLQIRIAGVAQLERAPPHCANNTQQRQSRFGKERIGTAFIISMCMMELKLAQKALSVALLFRSPLFLWLTCARAEVGRRVGRRCEAPPDGDEEVVRYGAVRGQVLVDQGLVLQLDPLGRREGAPHPGHCPLHAGAQAHRAQSCGEEARQA